jgi:hypothetical protein
MANRSLGCVTAMGIRMSFRGPDVQRLALIEAVDSTSPLNATTIINLPIDRIGQYHVRAIVRAFRSRGVLRFIGVSPSAFS